MYTFRSRQNRKLLMDREDRGISFHYVTRQGVYHVGRSWRGIHNLLMKLYNCQRYSASDRSLSAWMQGQELCLQFGAWAPRLEEVCRFSPAETARIMNFLGKAPNLN